MRMPPATNLAPIWQELAPGDDPIDPRDLFPSSNPLELEVGCGKGMFLVRESERRPEVNFIGVEWSVKFARYAATRLAKRNRDNVRIIATDARPLIGRFPASIFTCVHVYFPDPWWKKRHKKRRLLAPDVATNLRRVLQADGTLLFVTDVGEYFATALATLRHAGFQDLQTPQPNQPTHDLDYLTNFERKYRKEGRPIYRAAFLRPADAQSSAIDRF